MSAGIDRWYRMVRPEQVPDLEAHGWKVVGATAYGAGDISVLMSREDCPDDDDETGAE